MRVFVLVLRSVHCRFQEAIGEDIADSKRDRQWGATAKGCRILIQRSQRHFSRHYKVWG